MMITLEHAETGQRIDATGLWINPGVKRPRKIYGLDNLNAHQAEDLEPPAIEPAGDVYDKYRQVWTTWRVVNGWRVVAE